MRMTRPMMRAAMASSLVALVLALPSCGKGHAEDMGVVVLTPTDLKWTDGPPSLPPGAKIAVLEGTPSKAGPFTVRFKFPAGYKVPPHTHPADEHLTVLEGSLSVGSGAAWNDKDLKNLPVGGFAVMKSGMQHFAGTTGGVTLQLHGIGPWDITYVNASDDPRKR